MSIPPRRPAFDDLCNGWGSDGVDDLLARCELFSEFWQANFPLSSAEHKVAKAMIKRLHDLTGIEMPVIQ